MEPQLPDREDELARTKAVYAIRLDTIQYRRTRRRRSIGDMVQSSEMIIARETSPPGRGQKCTNSGLPLAMADKENGPLRSMRHQRPPRIANPSRSALEAFKNNTLIRTNSQHVKIPRKSERLGDLREIVGETRCVRSQDQLIHVLDNELVESVMIPVIRWNTAKE